MLISFVLASVVTLTGAEVAGTVVFALLISLVLVVSDDIFAPTLPFLLISTFTIKCHGMFDVYIKLWWLAIPAVASLIFHFVKYKRPLKIGPYFYGVLASAVAVTLGGLGIIPARDYFSGVSLFYTIGLGVGMLLAYVLLSSHVDVKSGYPVSERFSFIMTVAGEFACFMLLAHYIQNIDIVIKTWDILDFQWRNNVSTLIMLTLPFPFYLSRKKNIYIAMGIIFYICLLLSGSRGGLIFGTIEFGMCLLMKIGFDKKHRKINIIVFSALLVLSIAASQDLLGFISKTIFRIFEFKENKIRIGLLTRAVEDFRSNPLFGRGLAYFGNRDIHKSAEFALCWYHSSPFQIIGSFGIAGIVGFAVQYFIRLRIFFGKMNFFSVTLLVAWIGIEMMSLVNPGVFCPIPYLFLVTFFFVIMEKYAYPNGLDDWRKNGYKRLPAAHKS